MGAVDEIAVSRYERKCIVNLKYTKKKIVRSVIVFAVKIAVLVVAAATKISFLSVNGVGVIYVLFSLVGARGTSAVTKMQVNEEGYSPSMRSTIKSGWPTQVNSSHCTCRGVPYASFQNTTSSSAECVGAVIPQGQSTEAKTKCAVHVKQAKGYKCPIHVDKESDNEGTDEEVACKL